MDTAHVVASGATNRENLYVSMTRGRKSNTVYVALDDPDDAHTPPQEGDVNARTVLYGVLQRSGAELSAHQTIKAEQDQWSSIQQLAAEYETIAADAQRGRWVALVGRCGLDEADIERVISSESFNPLTAQFRRAEANGYDLDTLLPKLVASRGLADAADVGAVLISRVHHATAHPRRLGRRRIAPKLIVGLVSVVTGRMDAENRRALDERQRHLEQRATSLADQAVQAGEPWLRGLGPCPEEPAVASRWMSEVRVVAAYRDRYGITGSTALGPRPAAESQRSDRVRAQAALRRAVAIGREGEAPSRSIAPVAEPGVGH